MAELNKDGLPPGWECKLDHRSGKRYYINHFTKTTQWDDPRVKPKSNSYPAKQFSSMNVEHIPLQHGSPDIKRNHVYPSQPTPMPAFQVPGQHNSPKNIVLQEYTSRMSPLTVRSSKIQDSSFTLIGDAEESVAKISAMFPTVTETHIRMLMKNCRYMKSVFPKADETIIFEVLSNNDNNIQKTSDALKGMGFERKETVKLSTPKVDKKPEVKIALSEVVQAVSPVRKIRTSKEKEEIKAKLQEKYKDVQQHLINMALESVDFDENKANQILQIMIQEDSEKNEKVAKDVTDSDLKEDAGSNESKVEFLPVSQSRQSLKSLLKTDRIEKEKLTYNRVLDESNSEYRSQNLTNTTGPNPDLCKGTNDKLLLEDYVKWQGPNPNFRIGAQRSLAKGPNASLLSNRTYTACGANADLRKGPNRSLAKGSIFNQMKVILVGESRGK